MLWRGRRIIQQQVLWLIAKKLWTPANVFYSAFPTRNGDNLQLYTNENQMHLSFFFLILYRHGGTQTWCRTELSNLALSSPLNSTTITVSRCLVCWYQYFEEHNNYNDTLSLRSRFLFLTPFAVELFNPICWLVCEQSYTKNSCMEFK